MSFYKQVEIINFWWNGLTHLHDTIHSHISLHTSGERETDESFWEGVHMAAPPQSSEIIGQSKVAGPISYWIYMPSPVPGSPNYSKYKVIIKNKIKRLKIKS